MNQPPDDDARTIIRQAWQQVQATDAKRHLNRLAADASRFVDYAWKDFKPEIVLRLLLAEQKSYRAHKSLLFSGLCTWVVCPNRPMLMRHGMLLVGIEYLRNAETLGRAAFAGEDLLGDMVGRILWLGQDFYSDFYYPIGGIGAVLRSTTPGNFARSLKRRSAEIMTVVALMQVYHHHAIHLSRTGKHHKASLNKGSALVEKIFRNSRRDEAGVARDNINDRWQRLARTAALAYAASSIEVEPGRSLLATIRAGDATFEANCSLLTTWVGRARYATEEILARLYEPRFAALNAAYLPPGEVLTIPAPTFDPKEQDLIKEKFRK